MHTQFAIIVIKTWPIYTWYIITAWVACWRNGNIILQGEAGYNFNIMSEISLKFTTTHAVIYLSVIYTVPKSFCPISLQYSKGITDTISRVLHPTFVQFIQTLSTAGEPRPAVRPLLLANSWNSM